ncbi:MAG: YIP1 family protein [Bacillota bacterium]
MINRKACFFTVVFLFLVSTTGITVAEEINIPYPSYIYDFWGNPVPAPRPYHPEKEFTGTDLGIDSLSEPRDLFISQDEFVYIADSGNDRIIRLTPEWSVDQVFTDYKWENKNISFDSPRGVHVDQQGNIYIADRGNRRIVILDNSGDLQQVIEGSNIDIAGINGDNFRFRPDKIVVDSVGRIYVNDKEIFDGILKFDSEGLFMGFIGAPEIHRDLFAYLWRRFSPRERRERMRLQLPTDYSNLALGKNDFIYATVARGKVAQKEAVRRLNPAGKDTLHRRGFHPPVGDYGAALEDPTDDQNNLPPSRFIDLTIQKNSIYSVLDQRRGRIFTYDDQGNLLYIFGGEGRKRGAFRRPVALDNKGDKLVVLDALDNNLTVFYPTLYRDYIHQAIDYYENGHFELSVQSWRKILQLNSNFDLAYTGMGRGLLHSGDYAAAKENFRQGQNRKDYSRAFNAYRREQIKENFALVIILLMGVTLFLILMFRFTLNEKIGIKIDRLNDYILKQMEQNSTRKNIFFRFGVWLFNLVWSSLQGLADALHIIFHPFSGFWDLKNDRQGNIPAGTILLGLVVLTYIYMRQYTGFVFNYRDLTRLNAIVEALSILLPFLLWCIVNWSLTTLMEGKGTFKDIYLMSAYSLTPLILINLPLTVVSNFLTGKEGSFYYFFLVLAITWFLCLLFFGNLTIHQYDLVKTMLVSVFILMGIILCMFMGLLFFNLVEQVLGFVSEIYIEVIYRL